MGKEWAHRYSDQFPTCVGYKNFTVKANMNLWLSKLTKAMTQTNMDSFLKSPPCRWRSNTLNFNRIGRSFFISLWPFPRIASLPRKTPIRPWRSRTSPGIDPGIRPLPRWERCRQRWAPPSPRWRGRCQRRKSSGSGCWSPRSVGTCGQISCTLKYSNEGN